MNTINETQVPQPYLAQFGENTSFSFFKEIHSTFINICLDIFTTGTYGNFSMI